MRERAWADADLRRERAAGQASRKSFLSRLMSRILRR
jgi:hypothetical protein